MDVLLLHHGNNWFKKKRRMEDNLSSRWGNKRIIHKCLWLTNSDCYNTNLYSLLFHVVCVSFCRLTQVLWLSSKTLFYLLYFVDLFWFLLLLCSTLLCSYIYKSKSKLHFTVWWIVYLLSGATQAEWLVWWGSSLSVSLPGILWHRFVMWPNFL